MLEALEEHWPQETSWTHPDGGLFLWAHIPESINTQDFLNKALEAKVAYVPGFAFYPEGQGGENTMRLNFSNANEGRVGPQISRSKAQRCQATVDAWHLFCSDYVCPLIPLALWPGCVIIKALGERRQRAEIMRLVLIRASSRVQWRSLRGSVCVCAFPALVTSTPSICQPAF